MAGGGARRSVRRASSRAQGALMFKRIVVGVDGREGGRDALA